MKKLLTTSLLLAVANTSMADPDIQAAREYLNSVDQLVFQKQLLESQSTQIRLKKDIAEAMQAISKAGYKINDSGELVPVEGGVASDESLMLPPVFSASPGGLAFDNNALPPMGALPATESSHHPETKSAGASLPTLQHVDGASAYFVTDAGVVEAKQGSPLPGGFKVVSVSVDGVKVKDEEGIIRVLTIPWGTTTAKSNQL